MSREAYVGAGGNRSPRSVRRVGELPTVDRSPSRTYPSGGRGSPIGRKSIRQTRSGNNSPDHGGYGYHHQTMGSPYYSRDDDLGSPMLEERGRSMVSSGHHRSRSASRPAMGTNPMTVRYQSLDRGGGTMIGDTGHEREFMPIREPRERSLDRSAVRDRSLERGLYLEDELYGGSTRSARQSPHLMGGTGREPLIGELQHQNNDLQRELGNLKKELELTNQKLGSSMHSIKTFWSPELKKERALRKEESAKYSLINDQLKLLSSENQKQAMLVRQLEEELRMRMRGPSIEMQQQMEVLFQENEHLTREIAILRDTIKELELRIETQKQTLQARDESIKKLLEMLQNKGMGKEEERQMFQQMQAMAQKQLDEFRVEIQRRDQEILAMSAKMKTLEEQHQDYQRHIAVLKESLCAKEEHYNMLQADCEELRQRLDEKNRLIEKKTQIAVQAQQDRNRINGELTELKEHMDIKDRKINVLQRKLDLHEANKKIQQSMTAKPGEDLSTVKRQLDDQSKKIDEQSRQVEDQRRNVDNKLKQINEREKGLQELDKQLQRRKDQLDQLEMSLKKSGGNAAAVTEMNKELDNMRQQLQKAKDESQRSGTEMERLLQLVQMSQEEQNAKEKTIMELQQALKNAQAKLKSQQQAAAHLEEQRKKEEIPRATDQVLTNVANPDINTSHSQTTTAVVASNETTPPPPSDNNANNNGSANSQGLTIDDFEEIVNMAEIKEKRILELEEALRESMSIATEREEVLHQEESKRKQIMEKVSKLEQRLLSLQTAQAMRCHSCRPLISRLGKLEATLHQLTSERKRHLQEVASMKQEALEAAISEKDAHLALLEMSGIRTERRACEVDQLRKDKRRLMERLRRENELSITLIEECQTQNLTAVLYDEDIDSS